MNRRQCLKRSDPIFVAILSVGIVFCPEISWGGTDPAPPENGVSQLSVSWRIQELFADLGAISHVSLAVSPLSRDIFVSWYAVAGGDLWWARTVDSGGNCGPDDGWLCEVAESDGDVGKYSSLAIKPAAVSGYEFIMPYYDASVEQLKVVYGTVDGTTAVSQIGVIDRGFMDPSDRTGMYTAALYDSHGRPWIAYQNETYGGSIGTHWMIAKWVGDGSGNCGEGSLAGKWDCHDLFASGSSQLFSSSALSVDIWGRVVVAYYDGVQGHPLLARNIGAGGNCGPSDQWECFDVAPQTAGHDIGKHVVPFVKDGSLTLFYQNVTLGVLERAGYVSPESGNCGWSDDSDSYEWQCFTISDMDGIYMDRGIAVVSESGSFPVVAYQYGEDPSPGGIGIARPYESPEVTSPGNCGPAGNSWYCQIIDGGPNRRQGDSLAMTKNWLGEVFLTYLEVDYYPYPAEYNLRLANLPTKTIFIDSFELGNTSAWSAVVP